MHTDSLFFRQQTDGTRYPVDLANFYAGPTPATCWIIGGGPSLATLPVDKLVASPAPRFTINLAGSQLLRPQFWTSYDPTDRFHRSVYLDPSIIKFVHLQRAMDLVPETTFKVCECPGTLFFHRAPHRGFHDFLGGGPGTNSSQANYAGIVDWQDTLVQAIHIAYSLGFRRLLLAGCDMFVRPSPEQIERARAVGVTYKPRSLLSDFIRQCEQAGLSTGDLDGLGKMPQYHFDEQKPLRDSMRTDAHYFRVAQYLRLSRQALSSAGLEVISVTPESRLNDYFRYQPITEVIADIHETVGRPESESTRGRYTRLQQRGPTDLGPMRDFRPHNWKASTPPPGKSKRTERARDAFEAIPEVAVPIDEVG